MLRNGLGWIPTGWRSSRPHDLISNEGARHAVRLRRKLPKTRLTTKARRYLGSAPPALPPGFRVLYILRQARLLRLSKSCCQHGLKYSFKIPRFDRSAPWTAPMKEALTTTFARKQFRRVPPRQTNARGEGNA